MYPAVSVYDGCMTIKLSNGTIVSQSGVVYSNCLQYHGQAPDYVHQVFGLPGQVICCEGRACGNGAVYLDSWPAYTQVYDVYGGKGAMVMREWEDKEGVKKQLIMKPPSCKKEANKTIKCHSTFLLLNFALLGDVFLFQHLMM